LLIFSSNDIPERRQRATEFRHFKVPSCRMSAIGPKRTCASAHMSAFGGGADITFFESPLSRSLLGVKRTWHFAAQMSACPLLNGEVYWTFPFASHMSAIAHSGHFKPHGTCPLLGLKRTRLFALQMSASEPKRTSTGRRLKAYPPPFSVLV
jgi:hypothetical protein